MRKLLLLSVLVIRAGAAEPDAAQIKGMVEAARKAWGVPGVGLAIVKEDKTIYLAGHGVKESGKPDALTEHSIFQIASTTKAFTSAAIAMLVDEGKMNWDDPVRKHLDYFRLADPHSDALVTIRDLLSHRTGLPRHDALWSTAGYAREDLIRRMGFAKPSATFRSLYQYQNLMFTSAGEAAGKASGLGWDILVQQRIFVPLGMKDSATKYAEMMQSSDMAMPHLKQVEKVSATQWRNYDNIGGAGCIASSVSDLSRWLSLQLSGGIFEGRRFVSEKNLSETHSPQMVNRLVSPTRELQPDYTQTTYGLGWSINHYRGEMLVMHSGVLRGFRALVTMVPRLNLGFVVLANLNDTNLNEALTNTLLDEYLGLPKVRDWNAHMLGVVKQNEEKSAREERELKDARKRDTKPSLPLSAYEGSYLDPAYGEVKIQIEDGKLKLQWTRNVVEMEYWHYDTWRLHDRGALNNQMLNFQIDEKGVASKLSLLGQNFSRK